MQLEIEVIIITYHHRYLTKLNLRRALHLSPD